MMRFIFKQVHKVFGKDLTPYKIVARVPRVFWVNVLNEWLLGRRQRSIVQLRTASRVGCPF